MYSFKHLQYLVTVADMGHFSQAAEACHVTQSTLSLGIKELERQMGLQLFERSRKNIIPTPAGKKAISHARELLKRQKEFDADMHTLTNPNAGPLRIGAIPTIAPYFLPRLLPLIEDHFPKSDIRIAEDTTETILHKIRDGAMDVGVIAFPYEIGDLETKILFEEDFLFAFNPISHPEFISGSKKNKTLKQIQSDITLEKLQHLGLLLLRDGHCLKDHVLSACRLPKHKQNQFFEAESLHTLLAMVNQGYGITLLPDMAQQSNITIAYPNVVTKPFEGEIPTRQIGLVWRRTDIRRHSYLNLDLRAMHLN
jgi:LysR family hydrogen peroxide-inducible transcriptional activator